MNMVLKYVILKSSDLQKNGCNSTDCSKVLESFLEKIKKLVKCGRKAERLFHL